MGTFQPHLTKIEAVDLFDAYTRVMNRNPPAGWDPGVAQEGRSRLWQLDWILLEVQRREVEHSAAMLAREHKRATDLASEIELLAECFYYIGFRAQIVIARLPELSGFKCEGVRDVRNHLIEHPEKGDSSVTNRGFAFGAARGPVLRGVRFDTDPKDWEDAGLYANAREFRERLQAKLLPYLSRDFDESHNEQAPS